MNKVWYPAYIGLGSNLDGPTEQLAKALKSLREHPQIKVICVSSFYQTEPYGDIEQEDFVNAVVGVLTSLLPEDLLRTLLDIENKQGRKRTQHWGPRNIDLDLLVFNTEQRKSDFLNLPHLELAKRDFVLIPLAEIAPELMIVGLGRVKVLLEEVPRNKTIILEKN